MRIRDALSDILTSSVVDEVVYREGVHAALLLAVSEVESSPDTAMPSSRSLLRWFEKHYKSGQDRDNLVSIDDEIGSEDSLPSLDELGLKHGTDKASNHHNFLRVYDRYLSNLRPSAKTVVEIGVFNGASLKMWREYFHVARIIGLDVKQTTVQHASDGIEILIGDCGSPEFLTEVSSTLGPIDVVVDDGSHYWGHQQTAFNILFDRLRPGGIYIIEDINTSYHPKYQGPDASVRPTTEWLKHRLDLIVASAAEEKSFDHGVDANEVKRWQTHVLEVVFLRKACVVVKRGPNDRLTQKIPTK